MAKHKEATEITIVQEERSGFAEFVDRYKWFGIGLLALVAAVIVWRSRSKVEETSNARADWGQLHNAMTGGNRTPETLGAAAMAVADKKVAAWARMLKSVDESRTREFGAAQESLSLIGTEVPAILDKVEFPIGPDGASSTIVAHLDAAFAREQAFFKDNPLYENPPLPADAPKVEFETDQGNFTVGLYINLAPGHVKNFLKLVENGDYVGTKFHRVNRGQFIQGGDPNTKEGEPETWGLGGPEYTIPSEDSGLKHTAGALAGARKSGATESSGSQFYITVAPMHGMFDGRYDVFGTIIDGLDKLEELTNAETLEDNPERPTAPVTILSTRVIE